MWIAVRIRQNLPAETEHVNGRPRHTVASVIITLLLQVTITHLNLLSSILFEAPPLPQGCTLRLQNQSMFLCMVQ